MHTHMQAPIIVMRRTSSWGYRLCSMYVGWGIPYMMLSVNYETLFYCSLCLQVCLCMCVCMLMCVCVCICMYICVCMYICIYIW